MSVCTTTPPWRLELVVGIYTHHIHTRPPELHHCFTPITSTLVLQNSITVLHPSHPHSSSRTPHCFTPITSTLVLQNYITVLHPSHPHSSSITYHCFTPITSTLVLQNSITVLHPSHPHSSYRTIYNTIKYSLLSLCREICFLARHLHKNVQYS